METVPVIGNAYEGLIFLQASSSTRQLHVNIPEAALQRFRSLINRLYLVLQGALVLQQAASPVNFCCQPHILEVVQDFLDFWDEGGVLLELVEHLCGDSGGQVSVFAILG